MHYDQFVSWMARLLVLHHPVVLSPHCTITHTVFVDFLIYTSIVTLCFHLLSILCENIGKRHELTYVSCKVYCADIHVSAAMEMYIALYKALRSAYIYQQRYIKLLIHNWSLYTAIRFFQS